MPDPTLPVAAVPDAVPAAAQKSAAELLAAQLAVALPKPADEVDPQLGDAQALLASIAPRDGIEAMLAVQLIACHTAAMQSLGYSRENDFDHWNRNHAALDFARVSAELVKALARHRGRPSATMRMEHVVIRGQPRTAGVVDAPEIEDQPIEMREEHAADASDMRRPHPGRDALPVAAAA